MERIPVIVDGIEYVTKETAANRCRAFSALNAGSTFHNHAHYKSVRRQSTPQEREADSASGRCIRLTVTIHEWCKLYTDAEVLKTHPELKGLWRENRRYSSIKE
jgi:hypothetical protein